MIALGERVWDTTRYGDTVNERAVRILLECILVVLTVSTYFALWPMSWFSLKECRHNPDTHKTTYYH